VFVTADGSPLTRFRRAIERRNLWGAEDAARELGRLSLDDALQLVRLYADRESPKYERAALRWLERYTVERSPSLRDLAVMAGSLAEATRDGDLPPLRDAGGPDD
jgi:hypothetical protein